MKSKISISVFLFVSFFWMVLPMFSQLSFSIDFSKGYANRFLDKKSEFNGVTLPYSVESRNKMEIPYISSEKGVLFFYRQNEKIEYFFGFNYLKYQYRIDTKELLTGNYEESGYGVVPESDIIRMRRKNYYFSFPLGIRFSFPKDKNAFFIQPMFSYDYYVNSQDVILRKTPNFFSNGRSKNKYVNSYSENTFVSSTLILGYSYYITSRFDYIFAIRSRYNFFSKQNELSPYKEQNYYLGLDIGVKFHLGVIEKDPN